MPASPVNQSLREMAPKRFSATLRKSRGALKEIVKVLPTGKDLAVFKPTFSELINGP